MKKNLDFEVARDLFIKMKHYTIQNYLKKMQACWTLCFQIQILLSMPKGIVQKHEITQDMHCVMLLCFLRKAFVIKLVLLLANMRYLYEYWESNGSCKFIDINTYEIAEDCSAAVSETNNDHIQLYLVKMKVKRTFFI